MISILLSALLFGLVHPGSKLIMGHGLSLLSFCLLYVGIRLLAQLPLVIAKKSWKIQSKKELLYLLSLGVVGAALQMAEFWGISDGLPVGVVTFLVYTHPVWTILLSRTINRENVDATSIAKLASALVGITLITGFSSGYPVSLYIGPLLAGFFIALWISLSNKASKNGCSAGAISFYYDAFAFLILIGVASTSNHGASLAETFKFLGNLQNFALIAAYSIFIGFLPNYLFYWGSQKSSTQAAGFTLLLEPVISTAVSHFAWRETIAPAFALGALFIIAMNFPIDLVKKLVKPKEHSRQVGIGFSLSILLILFSSQTALGSIFVVEVVPSDSTDYTVTSELEQIRIASDLATKDYRKIDPKCHPKIQKIIRRGSESELYNTIEQIGGHDDAIIVGLSRTNFARLAAKALEKKKAKGISIGAAIATLNEINPNFVSIVSPWSRQWKSVEQQLRSNGCTATNTLGLFDSKSVLSQKFASSFEQAKSGTRFELVSTSDRDFTDKLKSKSCAFLAINYSDAQKYLTRIIEAHWKGTIVGTGDWNYYSKEVAQTFKEAKYEGLVLAMPTGWTPNATKESQAFSLRLSRELGESPSPISAYTYDAMLMALEYSCHSKDPNVFDESKLSSLPVLRNYEGIAASGNYLSKMFVITKRSSSNEGQ